MVEKASQIKRKHHHVWGQYLKRWSTDSVNVHYTTSKGNIVCESIKGVAMEFDFYKLCRLDNFDIEVIKSASKGSPPNLQKLHNNQLQMFLTAQKTENLYRILGADSEIVDTEIKALYSNFLEDTHSLIERKARPVLDGLAERNINLLDNKEDMLNFLIYLGHQLARTKNFKTIAIQSLARGEGLATRVAESMEKAWWFHSYMMGMNLGCSFYNLRHDEQHSLLINDTNTTFITADQPIINVHPNLPERRSKEPPAEADFYYPISPRVAYMICKSGRFSRGENHISEQVVTEMNLKMARSAITHIFGNSKNVLRPLVTQIGTRLAPS